MSSSAATLSYLLVNSLSLDHSAPHHCMSLTQHAILVSLLFGFLSVICNTQFILNFFMPSCEFSVWYLFPVQLGCVLLHPDFF